MAGRAGGRVYAEARTIRRSFLRENALLLIALSALFFTVGALLVVFYAWLLGSGAGWFTAGAVIVGWAWALWALLEFDGSRRLRDAGEAEKRTSGLYRKLRGSGWTVVDRVEFAGFDVDHVAVSRSGVFAIETKNTNVPWKLTRTGLEGPYRDPVQQARMGARKIRLLLKSEGLSIPVTPLLVLWGRGAPSMQGRATLVGDVAVANGNEAKNWQGSLVADARLDDAQVTSVANALHKFVAVREAHQKRSEIAKTDSAGRDGRT